MSARRAVTVIGMGDDGCASLTSRAAGAVARAEVLVGGERHLAFFPQFAGPRIALKGDLDDALARVAELSHERTVCVLASGDPLFFGVGARVARAVGGEHIEFIPAPTSVQWAFARTGLSWDDAEIVSVHGRPLEGLVARLRVARKVAVLTDAETCAPRIAAWMIAHGESEWDAWVCEHLAGPGERVRAWSLADLAAARDVASLHVLLLVRRDPSWRPPPAIPHLPEGAFAFRAPKRGLITKREVRTLSLAAMRIRSDAVVWDVGAGSGAVAVEAAMLAPRGKVFAIEVDPEGAALCRENARVHGTDHVHVVEGLAPEALAGLDPPDAVFVGGSKGRLGAIVEAAFVALRPGGWLVVNAVTLDSVSEAYAVMKGLNVEPEVTLVQIARGARLAGYQRYEALTPVHVFAARATKETA